MATRRWVGTSLTRRQKDTITCSGTGDWVQGDVVNLTIDNVTFAITIGTLVTDAQVATTIKEAINGSTLSDTSASVTIAIADGGATAIPQFREFSATVASNVVTLTSSGSYSLSGGAVLAGKPWTLTVTETVSGDETAAESTTITATSPNHASEADNWVTNGTPADGDTLIWDQGNIDMRWGLDTYASGSTAQPTTLTKYKSYSGNVGLRETNYDDASRPYREYRTTYFTTDDNSATTTADLEVGDGPGSGMFKWNSGAGQVVLSIYGRGTRIDTGVPCILWKGTHASNVVRNLAGDLGIAFFGGESATVATLVTGDGPSSSASTICGSGCTLTTVTVNGGYLETNSALTTLNVNAGTVVHKSGTVTTLNQYDGTVYPNGTLTVTTLNIYGGAFDCRRGAGTITITNTVQMYKGAKFFDPQGRAGNVVFKLNGCTFDEVTIILPDNKTFTPS